MDQLLFAWDLETVPDSRGRASEPDGSFPKLIYHSIVSIGALAAFRTETGWEVDALAALSTRPMSSSQPRRATTPY